MCGRSRLSESRWFFRRRKASLEKRGKSLREREGVTQLLPVLTFITHTVPRVLRTIGPHPWRRGGGLSRRNWETGEVGWALKVQGEFVWPSRQGGWRDLGSRDPPPSQQRGMPVPPSARPRRSALQRLILSALQPWFLRCLWPCLSETVPPCGSVSLSLPCFVSSLSCLHRSPCFRPCLIPVPSVSMLPSSLSPCPPLSLLSCLLYLCLVPISVPAFL